MEEVLSAVLWRVCVCAHDSDTPRTSVCAAMWRYKGGDGCRPLSPPEGVGCGSHGNREDSLRMLTTGPGGEAWEELCGKGRCRRWGAEAVRVWDPRAGGCLEQRGHLYASCLQASVVGCSWDDCFPAHLGSSACGQNSGQVKKHRRWQAAAVQHVCWQREAQRWCQPCLSFPASTQLPLPLRRPLSPQLLRAGRGREQRRAEESNCEPQGTSQASSQCHLQLRG